MEFSKIRHGLVKLQAGLVTAALITSISIPGYACKSDTNPYSTKQNTYTSSEERLESFYSFGKLFLEKITGYNFGKQSPSLPALKQGSATFFQHINYGGYSVTLKEVDYTLEKLLVEGIKDNDISSIKVKAGYEVIIFDEDNFTGSKWSFNSSNNDFTKEKINDKMTSVKIKRISATPETTPTNKPTPTIKPTTTSAPTLKPTTTVTPTLKPTPTAVPTLNPTPLATSTLNPTTKPTPTAIPTTKPTPTATSVPPPTAISADEKALLDLVNQARADANLKPLEYDLSVANVAMIKAQDMVDNNYFSHTSPTYGSPFDMMQKFGIKYSYAGENIAAGYSNVQDVFNGWMNSPGHKANILNSNFTFCGFGIANGGPYGGKTWVQMFIRKP